jgi:YfiH family protein
VSVVAVSVPGWPDNVRLCYTTREGGVSDAPYASFNIAAHVGDRDDRVAENRRRLRLLLPEARQIAWLNQVHGARVVDAGDSIQTPAPADASWTRAAGLACAIMSADCLPVMLTDRAGSVIAAVHAGWRGLAAGVIENAVAALPVPADALLAWLGPAIGPKAFEVGPEVMQAFIDGAADTADQAEVSACFVPVSPTSDRLLADLRRLATLRLEKCGVRSISGDSACTCADAPRFFSHRRDGVAGRMATLILRLPSR